MKLVPAVAATVLAPFWLESDTFFFAAEGGDDGRENKDRRGGGGHGRGVAHLFGEYGFDVADWPGEQDAALISEAWQEATDGIRRKFAEVSGNDTPGSLHAKLEQESTGD